jgi:hypothetical protein
MKENTSFSSSSPRQTKGAITLTLAAVVLFSGLWALWYTPTLTYEPRKSEQITNIDFILDANSSAVKAFEVGEGVEELSIGIWPQTIVQNYNPAEDSPPPPSDIPPVISAKILDSQGNAVRAYDNVTTVSGEERVAVQGSGTFNVKVSNGLTENAARMELRVTDVSKVPNHPLEAMGQWLTLISLPVFGLAAWFVISRYRHGRAMQLAG